MTNNERTNGILSLITTMFLLGCLLGFTSAKLHSKLYSSKLDEIRKLNEFIMLDYHDRLHPCGYIIIEYNRAINCKGDTISIVNQRYDDPDK